MTKLFVTRIAALLMLVINIVLISLMVFHKPRRGDGGPKKMIIEKLHFDADQIASYDELIIKHRQEIEGVEKEIIAIKNSLYSSLRDMEDTGLKDSLLNMLGSKQSKIDLIHYLHFEDIKGLCRPDQMPAFDAMTKELSSYFSPPKPKKR
jgi:hypothetical protein